METDSRICRKGGGFGDSRSAYRSLLRPAELLSVRGNRHPIVEHNLDLEFPAAFRRSRRDGRPRGIIKLVQERKS